MKQTDAIYQPNYVAQVFDSMSATYGLTNYISSFGFTERWRKACIKKITRHNEQPLAIYDLMSGMGELWPSITSSGVNIDTIHAVDISPNMTRLAARNLSRYGSQVQTVQADVLQSSIPSNQADWVVSSFGLKTFNTEQLAILAQETARILKPGGSFSFVEISVPKPRVLRWFYMFYLKRVIPVVGVLFRGNAHDYRMLGIYTESFGDSEEFKRMLGSAGLTCHYEKLFFGCATLTWGQKSIH